MATLEKLADRVKRQHLHKKTGKSAGPSDKKLNLNKLLIACLISILANVVSQLLIRLLGW